MKTKTTHPLISTHVTNFIQLLNDYYNYYYKPTTTNQRPTKLQNYYHIKKTITNFHQLPSTSPSTKLYVERRPQLFAVSFNKLTSRQ